MRNIIPTSTVSETHPDFPILREVYDAIRERGGSIAEIHRDVGLILRESIDAVIDTPHSHRWRFDQLEKTEKTYIGTRVEIRLRSLLRLYAGRLDLEINGRDVDIKFTTRENWMIPKEAHNATCLLLAADEVSGLAYFGIFYAREEYLSKPNRDGKRGLLASAFQNILWLFQGVQYPKSFWRTIDDATISRIFLPRSGTGRLFELFSSILNQAIHRSVVADVAQQKDYMKRVRANGGVRDKLNEAGLELLSGKYDQAKIKNRNLPHCSPDEFICTQKI